MGAAILVSQREVSEAPRGTPRMVHLAFHRPGCPPHPIALCGARISGTPRPTAALDCVVCAAMVARLESGKGE
jgi:hypothetical protein